MDIRLIAWLLFYCIGVGVTLSLGFELIVAILWPVAAIAISAALSFIGMAAR